jgi:hypothetical protein
MSPAYSADRATSHGPHTALSLGIAPQIKFAKDSPVEGDGFEISVPRQIGSGFEALVGLGSIRVGAVEFPERSAASANR